MKKKSKVLQKKRKQLPEIQKQSFLQTHAIYLLAGVILFIVALIRIRLLNIPLERDEGEYAYFGQLMLNGIPPYEAAYNMKFPGTYFIYAFFMMIFGQSVGAIHLGLLITNLTTLVFLFLIAKKLLGNLGAIVTIVVFALLSVNDSILGFAGHATHFVTLAAVAGIYVLLQAFEKKKALTYLLAGVLLGLAPIFKQSGIFFSVFGAALFLVHFILEGKKYLKDNLKALGVFFIGGVLPSLLIIVLLALWGVSDNFFFWAIEYPFAYGGQVPLERGLSNFTSNFNFVMDGYTLIWLLAALGLPLLFINNTIRKNYFVLWFILLLFLFSFLTIIPGLYFRPHYFVSLLPAIAILAGVSIDFISRLKIKRQKSIVFQFVSLVVLLIVIGVGLTKNSDYLFKEDPNDISRRIYGLNPFVESEAIGEFIERNTDEGDRVVVLGSEPQIYFHANRLSATGFIYMYPMMEDHDFNLTMQEQMIEEVEAADPEIAVIVDIGKSWLRKSTSPTKLFTYYINKFSDKDYEMIGSVEIYSDASLYKFTPVAMQNQPVSKYRVRIMKKRD